MHFELDADQIAVFNAWMREHAIGHCPFHVIQDDKVYEVNAGACGGALTFSFTPTGLGLVTKVKCACGEEANLTTYEDW